MEILRRLWKQGKSEQYLERVLDLASEFMLEASVLSGVLGILESAIALHDWPTKRVIGFSLGFAVFFFAFACILQLVKMPKGKVLLPGDDLPDTEDN